MTLPADRVAVDCARNTRSAGRAFSRFVDGRGGALKRVDFNVVPSAPRVVAGEATSGSSRGTPQPTRRRRAPNATGWQAKPQGSAGFFREADHNPRAPLVRVASRHLPGQTVRLFAAGRPVDPIAFEGSRTDAAGAVAVSLWRGIPIEGRSTTLTAEIRDANGSLVETFSRAVRYGAAPVMPSSCPNSPS